MSTSVCICSVLLPESAWEGDAEVVFRDDNGGDSAEEHALQFILERVVEGRVTTKASVILQLLSWVCGREDDRDGHGFDKNKKTSVQEEKFLSLLQHLPLGGSATGSSGGHIIPYLLT